MDGLEWPEWNDFSTPPEHGQECIVQWQDGEVSGGWLYCGEGDKGHFFVDTQEEYLDVYNPKYWLPLPPPKK